jgi:fermentation-respiration switch protein FrsA (DUF1100 family)
MNSALSGHWITTVAVVSDGGHNCGRRTSVHGIPLILVVHGNHSMDDFSDPGYDYLGELLASRDYIVASVDQNFLNGAGIHEAVLGGLEQDNDARGYLLLQHLTLWHRWHETKDHPFEGKVDTGKIALIGHSRGGEAAALAAAFNHLPAHPDNAMIPFDFGFDIGAVIALAPSDGQYQPRQRSTPLEDISHFLSNDSLCCVGNGICFRRRSFSDINALLFLYLIEHLFIKNIYWLI